jgi:hypothetical protein
MKVNTKMTTNTDMVSSFGNQETDTKETTKTMKDMVMARCVGWMEVHIKVNG